MRCWTVSAFLLLLAVPTMADDEYGWRHSRSHGRRPPAYRHGYMAPPPAWRHYGRGPCPEIRPGYVYYGPAHYEPQPVFLPPPPRPLPPPPVVIHIRLGF